MKFSHYYDPEVKLTTDDGGKTDRFGFHAVHKNILLLEREQMFLSLFQF